MKYTKLKDYDGSRPAGEMRRQSFFQTRWFTHRCKEKGGVHVPSRTVWSRRHGYSLRCKSNLPLAEFIVGYTCKLLTCMSLEQEALSKIVGTSRFQPKRQRICRRCGHVLTIVHQSSYRDEVLSVFLPASGACVGATGNGTWFGSGTGLLQDWFRSGYKPLQIQNRR